MKVINGEMVVHLYARSLDFIKRFTDGITQEESLLQPPQGGNCLNWVLGHLAISRTVVLYYVDVPSFVTRAEYEAYIYGSEPLTPERMASGDVIVHPLEKIIADLDRSQTLIAEVLMDKTVDDLAQPFKDSGDSIAGRLTYMSFHEGFHTGQLDQLRRLARPDEEPLW